MTRLASVRSRLVPLALLLLTGLPLGAAEAAACSTSSPTNGAFTVAVCITEPSSGSTLTGDTSVSATVTTSPQKTIKNVQFFLGTEYLLTDYEAPYAFVLPSGLFPNGMEYLKAQAVVKRGSYKDFFSSKASIPVTIAVSDPVEPADPFVPRVPDTPAGAPLEIVAVGDGANGRQDSRDVVSRIFALDPDMLVYLGDVYARGTTTEFRNWYGYSGLRYGAMHGITNPVVGNHEYETPGAAPYFAYWGRSPHYYSLDAGGWHFVMLDSTEEYGQVVPGTEQFEWLRGDLAAADDCTLVAMHHPAYSLGNEGGSDSTRLAGLWALLAEEGVDLVLAGHAHNYQRWKPLDASGAVDPLGVTQIISGTGGQSLYPFSTTDARVEAKNAKKFGVLDLSLAPGGSTFSFVSKAGAVLDQGAVTCSPEVDHEAPSAPLLDAAVISHEQVDLSWTASSDDVGVIGYRIWRDGSQIAMMDAETLVFSDLSSTPETSYTYGVEALDAAGNATGSNQVLATTPAAPDTTPPSAPPDLVGSAPDAWSVSLDWGDATDDVGVAGYDVYRDGQLIAQLGPADTALLETGLSPSTTYTYDVFARDGAGYLSAASTVQVTTLEEPPPPPEP